MEGLGGEVEVEVAVEVAVAVAVEAGTTKSNSAAATNRVDGENKLLVKVYIWKHESFKHNQPIAAGQLTWTWSSVTMHSTGIETLLLWWRNIWITGRLKVPKNPNTPSWPLQVTTAVDNSI
jgi:hypothetical protein